MSPRGYGPDIAVVFPLENSVISFFRKLKKSNLYDSCSNHKLYCIIAMVKKFERDASAKTRLHHSV